MFVGGVVCANSQQHAQHVLDLWFLLPPGAYVCVVWVGGEGDTAALFSCTGSLLYPSQEGGGGACVFMGACTNG